MITRVMDYCKKHFIRTSELLEVSFRDTEGVYTIEGAFVQTYIVGQYVYITNAILNTGAYKITAVAEGVLTVEGAVEAETVTTYLLALAIPKAFKELVTEISTWVTNNANKDGIASESIDDYSVSFGQASQSSGWQGAFKGKLSQYKSMYSDLYRYTGEA